MNGCQIANVHLAKQERQIVSKYLAIQDRQNASDDLAITERQIASDQDDTRPRHLAMLVMSCCHHQAKSKGIHVKYNTPPTENLLKTNHKVKPWH
jgi:hypothetical protein